MASPNANIAMLNCVISLASENISTKEGARFSSNPSDPENPQQTRNVPNPQHPRMALVRLLCMSSLRQAQVSHRRMRKSNYLTFAGRECRTLPFT